MISKSTARIFADKIAPNPILHVLWMDLTADPYGSIIKYWDGDEYIPITGILSPGTSNVFENDLSVSLMNNKTFGKYSNGTIIPAAGKTAIEVIEDAVLEYMIPSFSSFTSTISSVYEVATSLSQIMQFYFQFNNIQNISPNSLSLYDITTGTYRIQNSSIEATKNVDIGIVQKYINGHYSQWIAYVTDVNNNLINSNIITATWRYRIFYGSVDSTPITSSDVRAMNTVWDTTNQFQIVLNKLKYTIALPPGKSIISVITQNNEPIKSNFIKRQSAIHVLLGDGVTTAPYDIYDFESATIMNLYANVTLS